MAADTEILQRALGLRAPVALGRNCDLAHGIAFDARRGRGHLHAPSRTGRQFYPGTGSGTRVPGAGLSDGIASSHLAPRPVGKGAPRSLGRTGYPAAQLLRILQDLRGRLPERQPHLPAATAIDEWLRAGRHESRLRLLVDLEVERLIGKDAD